MDLINGAALVTGAGRGIGREIALQLAREGAPVGLAARTESQLTHAQEEIEGAGGHAAALPVDLAVAGTGKQLVARAEELLGPITMFVHAAGVQARGATETMDWAHWEPLLAVHVRAAHEVSAELVTRRRDDPRASAVVYIGSLAAEHGLPGIAGYAMAKSGLMGLMRTQAAEFGPDDITFNAIAPGFIRTEFTEELFQREEWLAPKVARTPLRRYGLPADVAGVAAFLCSRQARFLTAASVTVDGGWSKC